MIKGSCLCGKVTLEVDGALPIVEGCHCTRCRKWTGHFLASVEVPRDKVTIQGTEHITWYQSSEKARRGFCAECGSSLFFDPVDKNKNGWIGIAAGAFDGPTGSRFGLHIYTAEKGDYYQIADDAQQMDY